MLAVQLDYVVGVDTHLDEQALGQLRGVIVTAPDRLRRGAARSPDRTAARALWPPAPLEQAGADEHATRLLLRSLARRVEAATAEAAELEREILVHVRALAPALLDEPGARAHQHASQQKRRDMRNA